MLRIFSDPLYHGTIDRISQIDVAKGKLRKDFGRGFYMALNVQQAIGMMHKKRREFLQRQPRIKFEEVVERLYQIRLKPSAEQSLKIKVFDRTDMEWLDFILMCRENVAERPHEYDIVVGATADDDTMVALKLYRNGAYGEVGSVGAKETLLRVLEPYNLGIQCCLCTQKAVDEGVMNFAQLDWRRLS